MGEILPTLADSALAVAVTTHVLANRIDVRAGADWIALAWLSPFVGSLLYFLLGINRIARRARRFHLSEQPFDRSKSTTIDGAWSLVGSANRDVPSLRLNFEFDIEVGDRNFADAIDGIVESKMAGSRQPSLKDLLTTGRLLRMRNPAARLLLPYL